MNYPPSSELCFPWAVGMRPQGMPSSLSPLLHAEPPRAAPSPGRGNLGGIRAREIPSPTPGCVSRCRGAPGGCCHLELLARHGCGHAAPHTPRHPTAPYYKVWPPYKRLCVTNSDFWGNFSINPLNTCMLPNRLCFLGATELAVVCLDLLD